MQKKIRKLEKELQNKDRMCRELQERTESVAQFPQHVSVDKTCSQTQIQQMPQENEGPVDETESERDEDYGCESMLVSSKPSRIQLDGECIPLKKQTSLTPVHQPNKAFEENGRELIIEIDNTSDRPVSEDGAPADEQSQSAQSSSVQPSEFVKSPKVQSLIRQIVNLKASRKKNQ